MKSSFLTSILGTLILISACSSEPSEPQQTNDCILEIQDAWARPGKAGMMSAAYFTIINKTGTADTLLSASSDASPDTQVHLSFMNSDGLMAMEEQGFVEIPNDDSVLFKQGGLHIMIIKPERDLVEGDTVKLTLELASGTSLKVHAPVKANN